MIIVRVCNEHHQHNWTAENRCAYGSQQLVPLAIPPTRKVVLDPSICAGNCRIVYSTRIRHCMFRHPSDETCSRGKQWASHGRGSCARENATSTQRQEFAISSCIERRRAEWFQLRPFPRPAVPTGSTQRCPDPMINVSAGRLPIHVSNTHEPLLARYPKESTCPALLKVWWFVA